MNSQIQTLIVIMMVVIALVYVIIKAKKRLTTKTSQCGGCDKCGH